MKETDDYAYVVRLIQFLGERFSWQPFITCRDFDLLYHWWEKNIPADLVEESMAAVMERSRRRQRPVRGFSAFAAEVRKRHQGLLSLRTGEAGRTAAAAPEVTPEAFLGNLPGELQPLHGQLEAFFIARRNGQPADPAALRESLLAVFENDPELRDRTEFFASHLVPQLRRPDILRTYRLNYLFRRYGIPELD